MRKNKVFRCRECKKENDRLTLVEKRGFGGLVANYYCESCIKKGEHRFDRVRISALSTRVY
jgi:ribosomal protein L44E